MTHPFFLTLSVSGSAILGLIVGSFLNVVVARLPQGKFLVRPGSQCPSCQHSIAWFHNIPVFSYLWLRGRCRYCSQPISVRYPVIELLTASLFFATRLRFGWGPALWLRDWPFVSILIAVTFIDLELRIIPDSLSLGGLLLGLATSWLVVEPGWRESFIGAAVGFVIFYALAFLYEWRTHQQGLGGGDIKLLAMLGAFVGSQGVFVTILISSVLGSVVGITWALFQKKSEVMKSSIPFGPFLVVGALYHYLLGDLLWFPFMIPT